MSLSRLRLALVLVASCGGEPRSERVTVQAPHVLPQPPPVVDAGPPPEVACLAPLEGGKALDAKELELAHTNALAEPERSFTLGRMYFQAEHWAEAGKIFRALAFEQPDSSFGIYASQLYLECLNVIGTQAHRASCFEDMWRDVPALHDLYCTTRRDKNAEMCSTLDKIELDIERLRAQRTMERGAAKEDKNLVHASGEQFLAIVRSHCMPATSAIRCDEIAFNAAIAFIVADDEAAAKRVYAIMTDPKNKMDTSPLVPKLECRLDPAKRASCQ